MLLSGEAGIGKSRLTAALLEAIAAEPHSRLRHSCSQQRTDSALYPTIRHFERAAGFTLDDTTQTKLDKLDALLAQSSTSAHDAALFADMLSLPNDGRYPALELSPQQRRQQTLDLLVSRVAALSHQNPLLIIFEDAHWTDPTGLELFSRIIDKIPNLRVLLLITFRSEFEAPWVGQSHVTALTINRLPRREVEVMIDRVVGNKPLPASFRHDIIERTDGIPLFVEEMTKAVLEAGDEDATERAVAGPSRSVKVPASLHASLMARLDRLGSAKEVAQIGAVLGREFSYALLAAVAQNDETKLQSALEGLTSAGLLFRQGAPPHTTYFFKHALVQDAAYGTLLRERRRALHARIAEALETQFQETAENQLELVARHSTEAGLIEKAANFWAEAGRRSVARSALVEAIAQFTRALEQMAALPGTPAQRRKQIELQLALISPLIHVKGHSSPEVKAATERARLLIEQAETFGESPESPLLLYSVLYYSWVANVTAFNGDALRTLAAQCLALAEKQAATVPLTMGHSLMGYSLLVTGNFAQSLKHYDSAIALYDPAVHRSRAMLLGGDPRVVNLSSRSLTLWFLGYAEAALADTNHCLKDARDINQAGSLFYALNHATITHFLCGRYTTAESLANELCTLADEKGASMVWKSPGLLFRGWILARGRCTAGS